MQSASEIITYINRKDQNVEDHINNRLIKSFTENKLNFSIYNSEIELISSETTKDYPISSYYCAAKKLFQPKGFHVILDKTENSESAQDIIYLQLPSCL